jgi:hypothetical protein
MQRHSLRTVPDDELLARLADLLRQSRRIESDLVAHVAEVDARRLYAREACPSMFAYCTEVLHLSEAEAFLRIAAARASREHPLLLDMLADGRLHLSGVGKLAPHLTRENAPVLLERSAHKTKRQIEELIAELAPRPDAPPVVRKLPERHPIAGPALGSDPFPGQATAERHVAGFGLAAADIQLRPDAVGLPTATEHASSAAPARPAAVEPLGAARYKIQFTASAGLRDKLERLRALMRSQVGDGDLAAIIEAAVTEKLERLEAKRFAQTNTPRKTLEESSAAPNTRHVPAAVRRAVHERDGGRCRYVDAQGHRCPERTRLEFHHRHPFAHGGDHSPPNVALLCRVHNTLMAEHDFGLPAIGRKPGRGHSPEACLRRPWSNRHAE